MFIYLCCFLCISPIQSENAQLRKQAKEFAKSKKTPKIERSASSRIRLEAHKISLTPTSGRSPDHKADTNTEESNTEAENTADETTEIDGKPVKEEEKESEKSAIASGEEPLGVDSDDEEKDSKKGKSKGDGTKLIQSFDEV